MIALWLTSQQSIDYSADVSSVVFTEDLEPVKSSEYARRFGIDTLTARRHLSRFVELGIAQAVGSGPAMHYEVRAIGPRPD